MTNEANKDNLPAPVKEVVNINGNDMSNEDILAQLCVEAESISSEVRDCF